MNKLFYFLEPSGYNKYIAAASENSESTFVFSGYGSGIEERLFKWHNAWPLNRNNELPFKKIWFNKFSKLIPSDCNYILMAESFHLSYSMSFLKNLRKMFPLAKFCFVFSNPADEYNINKLKCIQEHYDAILTFAKDDAAKYHFCYCDVLPMKLPAPILNTTLDSDVFFIGKNKGRIELIHQIYLRLHSLGLRCKFYVVEVPDDQQLKTDEIIYNERISYEEVLQNVQRSRCVLELLQEGCNYTSIKTVEAMHYHKKLLTTNIYADQSPFFNSELIQIIRGVEDINKEFILKVVSPNVYNNIGLIESYDPLISFLDRLFMS